MMDNMQIKMTKIPNGVDFGELLFIMYYVEKFLKIARFLA